MDYQILNQNKLTDHWIDYWIKYWLTNKLVTIYQISYWLPIWSPNKIPITWVNHLPRYLYQLKEPYILGDLNNDNGECSISHQCHLCVICYFKTVTPGFLLPLRALSLHPGRPQQWKVWVTTKRKSSWFKYWLIDYQLLISLPNWIPINHLTIQLPNTKATNDQSIAN